MNFRLLSPAYYATNKNFCNNKYDAIQALRGLASLFVVMEHIQFLNCGAFGVDLFFIISGLMIMLSTQKNKECFLSKRAIRILPFYYTMTLGTYLLLVLFPTMFYLTNANPIYLIKSLLFIPFEIQEGVIQPILRIGWTINCEIFFYLLFFIAMKISFRYRGLICSFGLLILCGLNTVLSHSFAPLTFYGDPVMLEFILGIISYYVLGGLYHLYQSHKLPKWLSWISLLTILPIFIGLAITKSHTNILGFRRPIVWGLIAFVLVMFAFIAGLFYQMPRPLVFMGNISFSLYLMHYYIVMFLDRKVFHFDTFSSKALIGTFIAFSICIIAAYVGHIIFEKTLPSILQKRYK